MSEKRFTESTETFDEFCDIIDNGVTIACMRKEYSKNIVNLLNSLAEQLLKTEKQNKGLKEENEQLRKELDSFKPVMFQDMRKGTITLYSKGDTDE